MISLILLKLFTFSQILQGVPKLLHATVNKERFLQTDKVQWPRWQVSQCFFRKHLVGVAQGEAAQRVAQYLPIKCHESPALTGLYNFTQQSTYNM